MGEWMGGWICWERISWNQMVNPVLSVLIRLNKCMDMSFWVFIFCLNSLIFFAVIFRIIPLPLMKHFSCSFHVFAVVWDVACLRFLFFTKKTNLINLCRIGVKFHCDKSWPHWFIGLILYLLSHRPLSGVALVQKSIAALTRAGLKSH